nr:MAG TPA: hypothetical protein [Caudoviricetes sp.]
MIYKLKGVVLLEAIQVGMTTTHYDPQNMSKEQAVEQTIRAQESCDRVGGRLRNFTAHIPRKGEPWREKLQEYARAHFGGKA